MRKSRKFLNSKLIPLLIIKPKRQKDNSLMIHYSFSPVLFPLIIWLVFNLIKDYPRYTINEDTYINTYHSKKTPKMR